MEQLIRAGGKLVRQHEGNVAGEAIGMSVLGSPLLPLPLPSHPVSAGWARVAMRWSGRALTTSEEPPSPAGRWSRYQPTPPSFPRGPYGTG